MAWLATAAGIGAAWIFGVPRLEAFASQHNTVEAHEVTIRFVNPPQMPVELSNMLLRTASAQINGDPMRRDDLVAVRQALMDTGWFDGIDQVRRVSNDVVEINARFVRPFALIRDHEGDHLVDASGKLLPMTFERGAHTRFVAISGVYFNRPQRPGMQWEGTDVAAGIRLLQLINQQVWRQQVAEINVAGYLHDAPIKLRTDQECQIVWGGAPGEEPALEELAAGKIQRLNYLNQQYSRIDAGQHGEIDITDQRLVMAREKP